MGPLDPVLTIVAEQARVKTCHVYHCFQVMRVQGKRFHAGAFALFAGLELKHVTAIIAALSDNDCLPQGRAPVERRATRLPADWTAPEEYIAYAVEKRAWTPKEAAEVADEFHNWALSAPRDKGLKLDWLAAWRNWVSRSNRPDGTYRPITNAVDPVAALERRIQMFETLGRLTEAEAMRDDLARMQSNVVPLKRA